MATTRGLSYPLINLFEHLLPGPLGVWPRFVFMRRVVTLFPGEETNFQRDGRKDPGKALMVFGFHLYPYQPLL